MSTAVYHPTLVSMHNPFSRNSNSAGAPLPFIPRRVSHHSANSLPSVFPQSQGEQAQARVVLDATTLHETYSERTESWSSSSSESLLRFNTEQTKRLRNSRPLQLRPPEQSTPTPAVHRANVAALKSCQHPCTNASPEPTSDNETPRSLTNEIMAPRSGRNHSLRIDLGWINPANRSSSKSSPGAQRIRKKSGEPLKSSLKIKTPVVRGDLSVITDTAFLASKSEPTTPTHARSKSVQFAEQLERVKLFLAEQKPLAVSRDGSPTDDTSGTESDFPSFIYGGSDEEIKKKNLVMEVVNMPKSRPLQVDVMLEDISLSSDATIHGHLRVRNLAFQKWLAVRFTFDWWQTTSEVSAKYEQSLDAGAFDRFSFSIRIHDLLSRIEEKTLFMAIKYSVNGREIWDNNSGKNYQIKFSVPKPQLIQSPLAEGLEVSGITDLEKKLDEVAKAKTESVGSLLSDRHGAVIHGTKLPSSNAGNFSFNSATPLSSRYDFSASLKNPRKAADYPQSPSLMLHKGMSTHPTPSSNAVAWSKQHSTLGKEKKPYTSQFTRGSPRIDNDHDQTVLPPIIQDQDVDVVENDQISVHSLGRRSSRNHHRGYFDVASPQKSKVKMTPPGSPIDVISPVITSQRYHSFPPTLSSSTVKCTSIIRGSSEESTSTLTSGSSDLQSPSLSSSSSPSLSMVGDLSENTLEAKPNSDMASFLNKFCFYTGPDSSLDASDDIIQRSHSVSSVEEFLSSPNPQRSTMSTRYRTFMLGRQSPGLRSRSSSYDDVAALSGASTPTPDTTPFTKGTITF